VASELPGDAVMRAEADHASAEAVIAVDWRRRTLSIDERTTNSSNGKS
jgi:hypothetical protein